MEYLIVWAILGAASFSLAKGKNRNPWLWGFLGLIFGPISLLVIALLKPAPGPDQGYK